MIYVYVLFAILFLFANNVKMEEGLCVYVFVCSFCIIKIFYFILFSIVFFLL